MQSNGRLLTKIFDDYFRPMDDIVNQSSNQWFIDNNTYTTIDCIMSMIAYNYAVIVKEISQKQLSLPK